MDEQNERLLALYTAANQHWVHGETMRWTIVYNFLVGNTVLLVAWSQLFYALLSFPHSVGLKTVLIVFCSIGAAGSLVWTLLVSRSNRFAEQYFQLGLALEGAVAQGIRASETMAATGPFGMVDEHRNRPAAVVTHRVNVILTLMFAAVYLLLLIVSIYAAAGKA